MHNLGLYTTYLPVVIKAYYYSICFEQVTSMLARLSRTSSPRCPSSFLDCRLQGKDGRTDGGTYIYIYMLCLLACSQRDSLLLSNARCCRKNLNAAIYANSLVGMGVASSLYHSSRGGIRRLLRWADYTMIATTTLVGRHRVLNYMHRVQLL